MFNPIETPMGKSQDSTQRTKGLGYQRTEPNEGTEPSCL